MITRGSLIVVGMVAVMAIVASGVVGLLLAVLHGIEAGFWAAAYWWLDALASPEEAVLYSLDSITTRGASGLTLPQHWRSQTFVAAAARRDIALTPSTTFAVWPLFEMRGHPH